MKLPAIIALTLLTLSSVPAMAQNLYRYLDDEGQTVITGNLPQGISARGYEVIDRYGRVIQIVAPQLSRQNTAALQQETEQLQKNSSQKERDAELLRLYSSPDEMRSELQRRVAEIEVQIELLEGSKVRTSAYLVKQKEQVARLNKANKKIPEHLSKDIQNQEDQLTRNESHISQLNDSIAAINSEFEADIDRLNILLKQKHLQNGNLILSHLSDTMLTGEWRNRENLWLDWHLNEDGTFSSTYQQLGSRERTESKGRWELNNSSIVFTIDNRKTTDARGVISSKRLVEEIRTDILEVDQQKLLVLISGEPVILTRP